MGALLHYMRDAIGSTPIFSTQDTPDNPDKSIEIFDILTHETVE